MRRAITVLAVAGVIALAACSDDENGTETPMTETTAMSSTAPSGEQLCEFVPRESVELALGTADIKVQNGDVTRGNDDVLTVAGCRVAVGDDSQPALSVSANLAAEGVERDGFEERLGHEDYDQLPDDVGLGFSWAEEQERDSGETVPTGEAWVLYGDYFVRVWVSGIAQGRDPQADAVAMAQQVKQTLELSDEWTLPGQPPSR